PQKKGDGSVAADKPAPKDAAPKGSKPVDSPLGRISAGDWVQIRQTEPAARTNVLKKLTVQSVNESSATVASEMSGEAEGKPQATKGIDTFSFSDLQSRLDLLYTLRAFEKKGISLPGGLALVEVPPRGKETLKLSGGKSVACEIITYQ